MHSTLPLLIGGFVFLASHLAESLPTNITSTSTRHQYKLVSNSANYHPHKRLKQDEEDEEDGDTETAGTAVAGAEAGQAGQAGQAQGAIANPALSATYTNVGTILTGLLDGNIRSVLSGGTSFIPPGELRNHVDLLVNHALVPQVERVAQNVAPIIQQRFNQSETTMTPIPGLQNFIQVPVASTKAPSFFDNPLQAIQNRLQGSGDNSGDSNPLKAIQDRLQSLLNFGDSSNNKSNAANVNSNVQGANTNRNRNDNYYNNNNILANRYRVGQNVPSSAL